MSSTQRPLGKGGVKTTDCNKWEDGAWGLSDTGVQNGATAAKLVGIFSSGEHRPPYKPDISLPDI